ncbi:MAG: anthranilate phosphoribosyltransferase [Candidatus Nanopelagicales bacterium]
MTTVVPPAGAVNGPVIAQDWVDVLEALLAGRSLDAGTTNWVMGEILSGGAPVPNTSAFLVALRAKGETAAEVTGLVSGMMQVSVPLIVPGPVVDTCGTGGDRAHTVNISTMAAVVAAAAGARVAKHGNRAASSESGSADMLEALGVAIDLRADQAARAGEELGITFCFAPVFHPAMRHIGPIRRELKIRTVFNVLGPLANPANPAAQVLGTPDEVIGELMAEVLSERGTKALVVHGTDGLDELTVFGPSIVWDLTGTSGEPDRIILDPRDLGIVAPARDALRGGSAIKNASIFRDLLANPDAAELAGLRDAVTLNAAAALVAFSAAGGVLPNALDSSLTLVERLSAALPAARAALESGAARELLARWVETSQELAREGAA